MNLTAFVAGWIGLLALIVAVFHGASIGRRNDKAMFRARRDERNERVVVKAFSEWELLPEWVNEGRTTALLYEAIEDRIRDNDQDGAAS